MRLSQILIKSTVLVAITGLLLSCGGGGGGSSSSSSGGGSGSTTLAFGVFARQLDISAGGTFANLFGTDAANRHMFLYLASDIEDSGNITSLKFQEQNQAADITCPNTTIKLGHTNVTALTTTYADAIETGQGSLVTVVDDTAITILAGTADGYFEIPLTTPFAYNGVDNLIVEVSRTAACTGSFISGGGTPRLDNASVSSTVSNVAATGSATTDSVDIEFIFEGGDDSVLYSSVAGNVCPLRTGSACRHIQLMHLAGHVNGAGPITGIALISNEAPTDAASYTVNIMLGHSTLAIMTDTFADNFDSGSPVTVASNLAFEVPAGVPAGTPIWLPIEGSFNYNGSDNLIVDIEVLTATAETQWSNVSSGGGGRMFADLGQLTGTVQPYGYDTVFRFHGGSMGIIGGTVNDTWPFSDTTSPKQQFLYRASELGSSGTITSIACRLNAITSTAVDYPNFEVVLGHTDLTALTSIFANNLQDAATVRSGLFSIPAGLNRGDWIEIPLSTPFNYDSSKNLVVQHANDLSGIAGNTCINSSDNLRYPDRRVTNGDRTLPTGSVVAGEVFDLRIEFSQ